MSEELEQASLPTEKRKRGPNKPKEPVIDLKALESRIEALEQCMSKVATQAGQGNVLREFGLSYWTPTKAEMRKNRG